MAELDPWDRQPGETSKAYQAFQTYLDQGKDRSTAYVGHVLGKSKTLMDRWSSANNWVTRAAAWDSMPRKAVADAYAEMAAEIAADHRRVATKLLLRLEKGMDVLPEGATPSQTWALAHGAARQGHQFATELTKPESKASDEINDAIRNLLNKLAGQ